MNIRPMQLCILVVMLLAGRCAGAEVRAWEGEITIPTYVWQEDINPKFWAFEGGAKMSTTIQGSAPRAVSRLLATRIATRMPSRIASA